MTETQDWTECILKDISRTVKRDENIQELVLKTAISANSDDPLNLFVRGPSSIGKTNAVVRTIVPYFPKSNVWLLGGLSPTALVHDYGTLIDTRTGLEIDPEKKPTKENFTTVEGKKKTFNKEACNEALKEWRETLRNSAYLINLRKKIMVFLEAPHPETFARLRPILSHDVPEISYKFTDKKLNGLRTVHAILRGFPATIFCTTEVKHMDELASRSLQATPEMSEEKYHDANKLSGDIAANPWKYLSKNNPEIKVIADHIAHVTNASKEIDKVIIPYGEIVGDLLPSKIPSDMRHAKQFLSLIKQNALLNMFTRPVLVVGESVNILANLHDLQVTIPLYFKIELSTRLDLSKHILDFYTNVFAPVESEVMRLDENQLDFNRVTVERLVTKHNQISPNKMSSASIYVYLKELKDRAVIDSRTDLKDKRHHVYFSLTKPENNLDSLIKEENSLFSVIDLEKWLKEVSNYLTKLEVEKILFFPSLNDVKQGTNSINLLDENINYTPILVRYLDTEIGEENTFKTETKPNEALIIDSKIKEGLKEVN